MKWKIRTIRALSFGGAFCCLALARGMLQGLRMEVFEMQVNTPMSDALTRYLDLASDQMKLTAGNMANLDTPGYKTQGFDFEGEFVKQLNSGSQTGPVVKDVDGLVVRPDGNNVSMDREALQLAKTQLQFRVGVELLKREFSGVMAAIHAEAK